MRKILTQNKPLFWLGNAHFIIFIGLLIYYPFCNEKVLGINGIIKPMKFALSIWIYSWTMALILYYLKNKRKVKVYSWVAVICMIFEQIAITSQAIRGAKSHFNTEDAYGIILFSLMGVFILTITLWTAYITYLFFIQKTFDLHPAIVLSIKVGLVFFVVFSLFGGYISSLQGHTVGAIDGGQGLAFLNWSTFFGDLRVAHFFGIHSLQIIPLAALFAVKYLSSFKVIKFVKWFSVIYLFFVLLTLIQGLLGMPFIKIK